MSVSDLIKRLGRAPHPTSSPTGGRPDPESTPVSAPVIGPAEQYEP